MEDSNSIYKLIDVVGTSEVSWEDAVKNSIARASKNLRDLRIAEVKKLDVKIEDKNKTIFRAKVRLSFKYE